MASNRLVQARIDGSVKEEAATVLGAMGLRPSRPLMSIKSFNPG